VKYTIRYLELAREDVKQIKAYLSQFYPGTPAKFLRTLKERISALGDMPRMCEVYQDRKAYRRMVVSDYLVFYKIVEEKKQVEIHRVLHGRRDMARHLPD
jgi:addiction module RelE/StbE family toxin